MGASLMGHVWFPPGRPAGSRTDFGSMGPVTPVAPVASALCEGPGGTHPTNGSERLFGTF